MDNGDSIVIANNNNLLVSGRMQCRVSALSIARESARACCQLEDSMHLLYY